MATLLSCPSCRAEMQVPDSLLGRQVRCPTCRAVFECQADGTAAPLPPLELPPAPVVDELQEVPTTQAETPPTPDAPPPDARVIDDPHGEFVPCPFCAEMIPGQAVACPFCHERIDPRRRWRRRDVVPHRGGLLMVLGVLSLVCVVGILLCFVGQVFNLVGIGLGTAAWLMGNRDLAQIYRGDMDPEGQMQTKSARNCGIIGVVLNVICLLTCLVLVAVLQLAGARGFRW